MDVQDAITMPNPLLRPQPASPVRVPWWRARVGMGAAGWVLAVATGMAVVGGAVWAQASTGMPVVVSDPGQTPAEVAVSPSATVAGTSRQGPGPAPGRAVPADAPARSVPAEPRQAASGTPRPVLSGPAQPGATVTQPGVTTVVVVPVAPAVVPPADQAPAVPPADPVAEDPPADPAPVDPPTEEQPAEDPPADPLTVGTLDSADTWVVSR